MAKLWNEFDGEPFLDNPLLGLLTLGGNPRRKGKRGKKMAKRRQPAALRRYWATHRRKKGRKSSPARRRASRKRYRKNWISPGTIVAANPHRRRTSRRKTHHRRKRHTYRHNPRLLGMQIPAVRTIAFVGVGFVGPSMASGFLTSMFPTIMQTTSQWGIAGKYAVKIGTIAGIAWLVHRFVNAHDAGNVVIGGALNVGLSLVQDFAPGFLPANPLAMYVPTRSGVRAYQPTRPGLRTAQIPSIATGVLPTMPVSRIPNPSNMVISNPISRYGTPSRYLRY